MHESRETVVRRRCLACGEALAGVYCGACGQRELAGRHTLRGMMTGALGRLLNLERGLLHTVVRLTVAPGRVVRDYVAGRMAPYTHPAGYLLLCFALFAVAWSLSGGTGGGGDRFLTALAVPGVALVSRGLFWRAGLNIAEHLILVMYLAGHAVLLMAAVLLVLPLVPQSVVLPVSLVGVALCVAYFLWGYARFFHRRPWMGVAGGLLALVGGTGLWLVSLAALLRTFVHR